MSRLRWSFVTLLALCIGCEIFTVRMPTRASAGASITIEMDSRSSPNDTHTASVAVSCVLLPNSWSVTTSTYSRTQSGLTTTGGLTFNPTVSGTMNSGFAESGASWRCFGAPSSSYATGDFGTAKLSVTVGSAGSYVLRFAATDGSGNVDGMTSRGLAVDTLPDWRWDMRAISLMTDTADWTAVTATSDAGFVAVDTDGVVHQTANSGGTWGVHTINAGLDLFGIVRRGATYIAVGAGGSIYTASSPTGTWTLRPSGTAQTLRALCTDGTQAYAVGDVGAVAATADGITWAPGALAGVGDLLDCVAVAGAGAYAVTSNGFVFRIDLPAVGGVPTFSQSTDVSASPLTAIAYTPAPTPTLFTLGASGAAYQRALDTPSSWSSLASPTTKTVTRLRVAGDSMYAVIGDTDALSNDGEIFVSPVASPAWRSIESGTSITLNDIAITGRTVMTVGNHGVRLRAGVPALTYEATTVALPAADVSVTVSDSFSVRNNGSGVLYLGTPQVTPPFTVNDDCIDRALDPGEGCELTVSLSSPTTGVFNGTVTMPNNGVTTGSVAVSGLVGAQATLVAPAVLDFGSVAVGSTATRDVTLRNGGVSALTISAVAGLVTPTAPFAVTSDACSGQTLAASGTCVVTLTFHPAGDGGSSQAFDVSSSDASHPSVFVQVVGTGAPPSDIRVDASLAFDDVRLEDSKELGLLIRNVGNGPLEVSGITSDSGDFAVVDASAFTVAAGQSVQRAIRFAPSADGARAATLALATNDPDAAVQTVSATGTGLAPMLSNDGDDGCAATHPSLLGLLATCCACVAYRCARRPRHRRARSHA